MKIFFRNIHLYLSLAAGLVIMSCCFTGAILVFEKELQQAFNHDRYFVKQGDNRLSIEQLVENVRGQYPEAKIASVKIYPEQDRSLEIGISIPESKKKNRQRQKEQNNAGTGKEMNKSGQKDKQANNNEGRQTHTAFVNRYTGSVIELYNYRETFFYTMFSLHRWLLGGNDGIGKTITGIATFIFLFILITGIILWWPKNKAILKQRLKIKTNASWKRVNHDLHLVLGFYSAIFLFIFAFTALAWSFKWFNDGIYTITKTSPKPVEPPKSVNTAEKKKISYDGAYATISKSVTDVQFYNLKAPSDSFGVYVATVLPKGAHESASDNYYIDQYSGQITGQLKFADKNVGQRVRSTFKPIHVGSLLGLPSKIVACLVCIFGVTFPITGTVMWLNRLKKKQRQNAGNQKELALLDEDFE